MILVSALTVSIYTKIVLALQVIPERAGITYFNKDCFYNGTLYVKRTGRKSPYYLNLEGTSKLLLGNNVSLHLYFYEFLHNEYKPSFVEMHYKLCDLINKEPYVGAAFKNAGLSCPVIPGNYRINNIYFPLEKFPHVWPFEKAKIEASLAMTAAKKDVIAAGEVYMVFKQKPRKLDAK